VTASAPLILAGQANDTRLLVSVTNVSKDPVAIWWEVQGPDGPLYDCLTVDLSGPGGQRTLLLTGDRNASTSGRDVLGPGAVRSAELDLEEWSRAPLNGGNELTAGAWTAIARYRCEEPDCWRGEVVAPPVHVHLTG